MKAAVDAPTEATRRATGRREHPHCFVCSDPADGGLGLQFQVTADAGVRAWWTCPAGGESYPGIVHGGVVAMLLDAAMVHVLFARGIAARTGELRVRYHHAVRTTEPLKVTARLGAAYQPLYRLEAEVRQHGVLCATARAKFMAITG